MNCPVCGTPIDRESMLCPVCGTRVEINTEMEEPAKEEPVKKKAITREAVEGVADKVESATEEATEAARKEQAGEKATEAARKEQAEEKATEAARKEQAEEKAEEAVGKEQAGEKAEENADDRAGDQVAATEEIVAEKIEEAADKITEKKEAAEREAASQGTSGPEPMKQRQAGQGAGRPEPMKQRQAGQGTSGKTEKPGRKIPGVVLGLAAAVCLGTAFLSTWMLATKTTERRLEEQAEESVIIEKIAKKEATPTPELTPEATPEETPTPKPTKTPTPKPSKTPTPAPEPEPEPEPVEMITVAGGLQADVKDFIFPYSSQQMISLDEMDAKWGGMGQDDKHYYSQLAIDELLFRHGWTFSSVDPGSERERMLNKFYATDWYMEAQQYYPQGMDIYDYMANYLNGTERANIDLICDWQQANGVYY